MSLLTVHTLTALPWHNLNRDETGAPKQVTEGGVVRARLSSQSLKRAARVAFERHMDASVRTKQGADLILARVEEIRGPLTETERKSLTRLITTRLRALTRNDGDDTGKKETIVWLSATEVEQAAQSLAAGRDEPVIASPSTSSLPIAAFGRMFAAAPGLNIPAAVSVGDAITTHQATIELDWFAAVDDLVSTGAGQLGFTMQTTGVYYRSFTIDSAQLARSFGLPLHEHTGDLRTLVRHLTLALPQGRDAGTAAQTLPALVLAEEQAHRVVYDFHEPVKADASGFLHPSIGALLSKSQAARRFDPTLFGETYMTGTHPAAGEGTFEGYLDFVLARIL